MGNPGNCGSQMASVIFMIFYLLLAMLVIVNMYIAVILENYQQASIFAFLLSWKTSIFPCSISFHTTFLCTVIPGGRRRSSFLLLIFAKSPYPLSIPQSSQFQKKHPPSLNL